MLVKNAKIVAYFLLSVLISSLIGGGLFYALSKYERAYEKNPEIRQRFHNYPFTDHFFYALLFIVATAIVYYIIAFFLAKGLSKGKQILIGAATGIIVLLAFKFTSFGYPVFQVIELLELIVVAIGGAVIALFRYKAYRAQVNTKMG
ncbi:MAG: hypothetical protein J0I41_08585 [Filimonas sp.]|nr:hypothetical protein [Filimonas sp.]